jgi:plasmid stability protein
MASLTLKNLPEDLLRALRKAAIRDGRSMTQEIIHLLEGALGAGRERAATRRAEVEAQVAAWRKLAGRWESALDDDSEAKRRASGPRTPTSSSAPSPPRGRRR